MAEDVVANPTYLGHIRFFFEDRDISHMQRLGIDLSTYSSLKDHAVSVHHLTAPPKPTMPPDAARRWSAERSATFYNWIRNGFPLGEPTGRPLVAPAAERMRKDVTSLSDDEWALLAQAFQGIMGRAVDDPTSYFALAAIHWFPPPSECLHKQDRYNPWHRAYMKRFEDALRSVPGCEAVTLPFWDITRPPPPSLYEPPFDSYTLPVTVHPGYPAGFATRRNPIDRLMANVSALDIPGTIDNAMRQPVWEDFITHSGRGIEAAHDAGHLACGDSMDNTDVAAFDPLFWFFHANWDRLWWEWQQRVRATTLATFRSTVQGSTAFLESAPWNELKPFEARAEETIDLAAMGIGYESAASTPATGAIEEVTLVPRRLGHLLAVDRPRVPAVPQASVRLKDIDRLAIPGSFYAVLRADGEEIGRRAFFQSTEPDACTSCQERALVSLDFLVDVDKLLGRTLSASIELARPDPVFGDAVPLRVCGEPTLNVRLLLEST